jgi:hypothetical protein
MKRSHILKAWVSTLIGITAGIITTAATAIAQNSFDWKAVLAGAVPAFLLSVTDLLKEVQKQISNDEE